MSLLIGLDHGGSTVTAVAVDPNGEIVGRHGVAMPRRAPHPGWVEHDPEDFLELSLAALRGALAAAGRSWRDVGGVGVANQGETTIAWDAVTGRPLAPALSWQDRRTTQYCEQLIADGHNEAVRDRTGLPIDPYFAASKIRWLIDHSEPARDALARGTLRVGGSDAFVIWRLTRGDVHATDPSTASRTALMDLKEVRWDAQIARNVFDIPLTVLPEIRPTVGDFGRIRHPDLVGDARFTADVVDANAALFAQGGFTPEIVKATYGTGAFIAVNVGAEPLLPSNGLLPFVAWEIGGATSYAVEGGVFDVGTAINWLVQTGLLVSAESSSEFAAAVPDGHGVIIVPSFSGLAAPRWEPRARAAILGLTLDTHPHHLVRAMLEGIVWSVVEILDAVEDTTGVPPNELRADGGPTQNTFLMQLQADLWGRPVSASQEPELTAFGAALMAGLGSGAFTLEDVRRLDPPRHYYEPLLEEAVRLDQRHAWQTAVDALIAHAAFHPPGHDRH